VRSGTTEGVDIKLSSDTGGGYAIGWNEAGEWQQYTVNVISAGTYNLEVRVATPYTGKSLHIEVDGINVTGSLSVPVTGPWDTTWGSVFSYRKICHSFPGWSGRRAE